LPSIPTAAIGSSTAQCMLLSQHKSLTDRY